MNSNTAFSELSPLYPQLLASTIKLKAGRHIVITKTTKQTTLPLIGEKIDLGKLN